MIQSQIHTKNSKPGVQTDAFKDTVIYREKKHLIKCILGIIAIFTITYIPFPLLTYYPVKCILVVVYYLELKYRSFNQIFDVFVPQGSWCLQAKFSLHPCLIKSCLHIDIYMYVLQYYTVLQTSIFMCIMFQYLGSGSAWICNQFGCSRCSFFVG